MPTLAIDIETYSSVDITKAGLYKYVESPDFEILLFAYAFDDQLVQIVDVAQGEKLPDDVADALTWFDDITLTAHNANFERVCISKFYGQPIGIERWDCTMIKAANCGLPLSLDAVGKVLGLENQKMAAGKALINYFSKPCKPTKANGGRTRNLPRHDLDKWELFKTYCKRDVEVERDIRRRLSFFQIPQAERAIYKLDQEINDRGVLLDTLMIENAISIDADYREKLTAEAVRITGLDNPNSVSQLKDWIEGKTGEEVESLNKGDMPALIGRTQSNEVKRLLRIRQELSKTSVKKYDTMIKAVCEDDRVRGLLQFYGANRTGRWAGRLVQVQNLPQNHIEDLDLARGLVKDNDAAMLEMLYGNVPDVLSQLIRTAFIAKPEHTFAVADFSAIEARVIAWLANEKWRLEVFEQGGDIYCASASMMFKVPVVKHGENGHLRQKGKIAELALGYQGGVGAMVTMGAIKMGIPEDELQGIVDAWRLANPAIKKLWRKVEDAAVRAFDEGTTVPVAHGVSFTGTGDCLYANLPNGRKLTYWKPTLKQGKYSPQLQYQGMDQTTKQWRLTDTYGGKLTENLVQAIARDCLAHGMLKLDKAGFPIVMHIHDENIAEVPIMGADKSLKRMCDIMGEPISWAPGLLLRADGYLTNYYRKD
jgi:DNA polymerase I - 3''-5'' exonuclease and polymerase domains